MFQGVGTNYFLWPIPAIGAWMKKWTLCGATSVGRGLNCTYITSRYSVMPTGSGVPLDQILPVRKKKKSFIASKLGCDNCKKLSRRKCDEALPECAGCVKKGVSFLWLIKYYAILLFLIKIILDFWLTNDWKFNVDSVFISRCSPGIFR